ncbi:NUDIX domain-containing protein [uncultured Gulosibacter sp.]|uniref:NUDIX domain-containing protein n=1 Tax=uncultured Gulosibacter sp. TaxID=1339167 RepID=UPI0028898787|nr:NUDIX domain-containing protein [uncultured Gulosibacter sp.]
MEQQRTIDPQSGDAWVYGPRGNRMWGRYGAAGLAIVDQQRGILLQHRASWSHHGDTWGIPGGARDRDETATAAALREAHEELTVPPDAAHIIATRVLDLGFWSYTTVVAEARYPFQPQLNDAESADARWVPFEKLPDFPLHPGFASSLTDLDWVLHARPVVVVDLANLMGTVPDGWWRDRAAAARTLIEQFAVLSQSGVPASLLGLPLERIWPRFVIVLEGAARPAVAAVSAAELISLRAASGSGDDELVATVEQLREQHPQPLIALATADRELQRRARADATLSCAELRTLLSAAQGPATND